MVAVTAVLAYGVMNREWVVDYFRGQTYQPSSEMAKIRDSLNLTDRGTFLFNASQPALSERSEFNARCRDGQTEIAVLGCYTGGYIYVYNIVDDELSGIRELTTAHELLHAVFSRMSEEDKNNLRPLLDKVYWDNQPALEGDLNTYTENERFEELYVRAGTEIANLPEELEKHYSEIFKNQDAVVAYYNKYNSTFRQLETEMSALKNEMNAIGATIDAKTAEYESRADQLDASIVSFNSCADVAGCFKSEEEFYADRNALLAEQQSLLLLYDEINSLINQYNVKVNQYNADVTHGEELNTKINSSIKPQEVK